MNLSGLSSFGSAVYPGFVEGENNQATVVQNQERAKQSRFQTQDVALSTASEQTQGRSLALLAQALGVAAPDTPSPMAPGEASQPSQPQNPGPQTSSGAPVQPPGGYLNGGGAPPVPGAQAPSPPNPGVTALGPPQDTNGAPPPPSAPQQPSPGARALGPPQPAMPPPAPRPAPQQGAPPAAPVQAGPAPAAARPPQGGTVTPNGPRAGAPAAQSAAVRLQTVQGQMSLQQVTSLVLKANPGIEKNPALLMRTVQGLQKLMAPDAKMELVAFQIQQKIDMANQKFELGQMTLQNKLEMIQQANAMKLEIAKIVSGDKKDALAANLERLMAKLEGAKELQGQKDVALGDRLDKKLKSTETIAGMNDKTKRELGTANNDTKEYIANLMDATKRELGTMSDATKRDIAGMSNDTRKWIAEETTRRFASQAMPDDTAEFMAELVMRDPAMASHIGGYGQAGQANKNKVWGLVHKKMEADNRPPGDIAAAKVAMIGAGQEARTVGGVSGSVALGTKEIEQFAPLVLEASKKVNRTEYPTVNAISNAVSKGTGGAEVVKLNSYIQSLKNAYAQVLVRGGRSTEGARKASGELIDKAWSDGQIGAAIEAMRKEAKGAGVAARGAKADIAAGVSGRAAPDDASGADKSDPAGIR